MTLNYKEIEEKINSDIKEKRQKLNELYKTLDEIEAYGYAVVFGANDQEETIKSSFDTGRAIGELEGQIDELTVLMGYLYSLNLSQDNIGKE